MRNRPPDPAAGGDYLERVHRALDFVRADLARPIRLEDVARAAGCSPFHSHRVFKALMGETLHQFVQRARLERALSLMSLGGMRLTDIALACGFSSSSDFTRAFKQRHGGPPSRFDLANLRDERREELLASMGEFGARPELDRLPPGENPDGFEVRLRDLPARTMAYVRVHDPYRGGVVEAIERLLA